MNSVDSRFDLSIRSLVLTAAVVATALAVVVSSTASAGELPEHKLEMEVAPSHPKVGAGESTEAYATIDVDALDADVEERPPMNLALVLDRSGSMRGARIEQARESALHLVDALDERDRVSLVTYASDKTVEFQSRVADEPNRREMRNTIRGIEAGGMTNISAGFEAGVRQVERHHDEEAVNRVIMMSDGKANRGITDPDGLQSLSRQAFDKGISTSTIGFGLDYNEEVMTGMAVQGSGNYYFADDSDDLGALVGEELSEMLATVANRIEVFIDPGEHVEIAEVYGYSTRHRDGKTVVPLSELGAGQSRSIVVRMFVTPRRVEEAVELMDVRTNYRDAIDEHLRYRRETVRAGLTGNAAEVERHLDEDVLARIEEVRLAVAMDEAMGLYSSGDREAARSRLEDEMQRSRQLQDDHGIESTKLDDIRDTYEELEQTVSVEPASSSEGQRLQKDASGDSFELMR